MQRYLAAVLHIEATGFDVRSLGNVSRFHGIPPVLWPRVLVSGGSGTKRLGRFRRQSARSGRPRCSATSMTLGHLWLEQLRTEHARPGVAPQSFVLASPASTPLGGACAPPRRRRGDEASGEDLMLTPETRGRQRHRRMATHGDSWQMFEGWRLRRRRCDTRCRDCSMRIVALSDQHGFLPDIPPCDLLIVAGDVCPDRFGPFMAVHDPHQQQAWFDRKVRPWLASAPATHRVLTWEITTGVGSCAAFAVTRLRMRDRRISRSSSTKGRRCRPARARVAKCPYGRRPGPIRSCAGRS